MRLNMSIRAGSLTARLTARLIKAGRQARPSLAASLTRARDGPLVSDCCWRCYQRLFSTTNAVTSEKSRWVDRHAKDVFVREAKVQGFAGRAAFKLIQMDEKYHLFKPGQMVVDLGYAPGSWSQVASARTKPSGCVLGIDLIPAQPPKGVSTIQGNFLSPSIRKLVKEFLVTAAATRPSARNRRKARLDAEASEESEDATNIVLDSPSYLDMERKSSAKEEAVAAKQEEKSERGLVDVVLSDMSEPWPQTYGFWLKTLSKPYRLMNTSGINFRDHAVSMDLCDAALEFANDTLRPGGHFVCKFYPGNEDKALETRLKKLFARVHREKPKASQTESKEMYFVALRRKPNVHLNDWNTVD